MHIIRRSALGCMGRLASRQGWRNLGGYTATKQDADAWNLIREKDTKIENFISKYAEKDISDLKETDAKKREEKEGIDWNIWEQRIAHKDILKCMQENYKEQMSLLEEVSRDSHEKKIEEEASGWDVYEECITSCEKSVDNSERLVQNGARALWISFNNPNPHHISANEWLESDAYWSAYVEKHHASNPSQIAEDPEMPHEIQEAKNTWHSRVGKFNDRSDTPILFQYMEQLPSWEYYDVHRRAFLEHMLYYLVRSGGDYRFFPEVPPIEWLTHIEQLRYNFLSVTQRRRAHFQLSSLSRELPLDLQPLDFAHEGEEFYSKFLQNEIKKTEIFTSRLMGNYMFLCSPYIPVQNTHAFLYALNVDEGRGEIYSFGEDVNALFYLPVEEKRFIHPPKHSFNTLMDYLSLTGRRLNPAYASFLEIHADVLQLRGENWLKAPEERIADAFLRRLRKDDPSRHIYEEYIKELKVKIDGREKLTDKKTILEKLYKIEKLHKYECMLYKQLLYNESNLDTSIEGKKEKEKIVKLNELNEINNLIQQKNIFVVDEMKDMTQFYTQEEGGGGGEEKNKTEGESKHKQILVENAHTLVQSMAEFDTQKDTIAEMVRSLKMGRLEK